MPDEPTTPEEVDTDDEPDDESVTLEVDNVRIEHA